MPKRYAKSLNLPILTSTATATFGDLLPGSGEAPEWQD